MAAVGIATGTHYNVAVEGVKINTTAGEALGQGNPCYIDSNGQAKRSVSTVVVTGTFGDGMAQFDGFCAQDVPSGEAVTLFGVGTQIDYGSGLTAGTYLWASATAGILSDVQIITATQDKPIAKVISTKRIVVLR